MKWLFRVVGNVCLLSLVMGCVNLQSYVDPTLRKVQFDELKAPAQPLSIGVLVEFQQNGEEKVAATGNARKIVLNVLETSNLFSSVHSGVATSDRHLKLVIDNTGGSIKGSGTLTGLTFGAVGTATTDRYYVTATFEDSASQSVVKEYQHALHSTIGSKSGPEGLEPMPTMDAWEQVIGEVVLLLLYDLQADGLL